MNDLINNPMSGNGLVKHQQGGSSATADSSRAVAEVQAALTVAMHHPRNQIHAMDRIINAFSRPSLAESSQYQFARGGSNISGPSIRAAEAIAQQWGNINFGFRELTRTSGLDGIGVSEVSATAWDMETNTIRTLVFHCRHWRYTKKGGYALTDERDIYELIANQAQRRVRSCILAVIPGDVIETAMKQADVTLKASADTSPESIAKMVEAFSTYGVTSQQIEARIQRRLDSIHPSQVIQLKKIYASLRDGMSSAADWFESAEEQEAEKGDAAAINAELQKQQQDKQQQDKQKAVRKKSTRKKAAREKAAQTEVDPTVPVDAQTEPKKPTFAVLMDQINVVEKLKDLIKIKGNLSHLPQDQQEELKEVIEMREYFLTAPDPDAPEIPF